MKRSNYIRKWRYAVFPMKYFLTIGKKKKKINGVKFKCASRETSSIDFRRGVPFG